MQLRTVTDQHNRLHLTPVAVWRVTWSPQGVNKQVDVNMLPRVRKKRLPADLSDTLLSMLEAQHTHAPPPLPFN